METTTGEIRCRLCFSSNGLFLNIFNDASSVFDIAELLKRYFQDEVKLSDPLPNIICSDCWHKTESFHEFHEKVLNERKKYLNLHFDVTAIKTEPELMLVTQSEIDEFCAESITNIDGGLESSVLDDNGSKFDYDCIVKTDYEFESNSWAGGDNIQEDFDECSTDEHSEDDNDDHDDDDDDERSYPKNSSLPTNIKQLSASQIHKHLNKNAALKRFICDICDARFTQKNKVACHILDVHAAKKKYFCEKCRNSFRSEDQFNMHNRYVHSGLDTKLTLKRIEEYIRTKFDMKCEMKPCEKVFESLQDAKKHYFDAHNILNGWIKCCNLKFLFNIKINEHIAWHINPTIFQCPECGKLCNTRNNLKRHQLVHKQRRHKDWTNIGHINVGTKEECGLCDKIFENFNQLHTHLESTHPEDLKNIKKDTKNITLLDLNDERMKSAMKKFINRTCDICKIKMETLDEARSHYLNEHKKQTGFFKCCNSKLSFETTLIEHLNWHVNPNIFRCPLCGKVMPTRKSILRHIRLHTSMQMGKFNCKICSESFPRIDKYRMHMASTHSIKIPKRQRHQYECSSDRIADAIEEQEDDESSKFLDMTCNVDNCSTVFSSLTDARSHYIAVHNNSNGFLKCCDTRLKTQLEIREHIKWHKNPGCFKCEECGRDFKIKRTLLKHYDIHKSIPKLKFKCTICEKIYRDKASLVNHMRWHENRDSNLKFSCSDCSKSYYSEVSLKSHRKYAHLAMKMNFICDFCANAFKTRSTLKKHLKSVHSQGIQEAKQKFKCDICLKFFSSKGNLGTHKRTHNNTGQFKCALCNHVARNQIALAAHVRAIHNSAKFNCTLCDRSFKLADALRDHIATHLKKEII